MTEETQTQKRLPITYYIDKKDFLNKIIAYRKQVRLAKKQKKPKPKIPDDIAKCIVKIAENVAKHPNYSRYPIRDQMISDGIETCLEGGMDVITEDGEKPIRWIVNTGYKGKVLSLSQDGHWQWKKILTRSKLVNKSKSWIIVRIESQRPRTLICTPNHLCSYIANPLQPVLAYLPAKRMTGKWTVRNYRPNHLLCEKRLYNIEQTAALLGIMMGDGYIDKEGEVIIPHCEAQLNYNIFNQKLLGGRIRKRLMTQGYGKGHISYRLTVPPNGQTKHLRDVMYDCNKGKKTIKNILRYLTEVSLAFWYMDDGYLNYQNGNHPHAVFCTDGFSDEDVFKLQKLLKVKWGLKSTIIRVGQKRQPRIRLWQESSLKFFKMIASYVQPCLRYKLPTKFHDVEQHVFNTNPLDYVISKVFSVDKPTYRISSCSYDIGIENNHNFVANQNLVHNCIRYFDNFDPRRASKNPFGYFSKCCIYAFWKCIGLEKRELYGKYKLAQQSGLFNEYSSSSGALESNGEQEGGIQTSPMLYSNLEEFIGKYEESLANKKQKKIEKKKQSSSSASVNHIKGRRGLLKFAKAATIKRNRKKKKK